MASYINADLVIEVSGDIEAIVAHLEAKGLIEVQRLTPTTSKLETVVDLPTPAESVTALLEAFEALDPAQRKQCSRLEIDVGFRSPANPYEEFFLPPELLSRINEASAGIRITFYGEPYGSG